MSEADKKPRERAKEQTKQLIIAHSKEEFLKNGFLNLSVRSLAKSANLTSGAIYTHFKDKAELFESLVSPALADLKSILREDHEERMGSVKGEGGRPGLGIKLDKLRLIVGKLYEHFTEFRLLMVASAGSGQEDFLKGISEYYSECTELYLGALRGSGRKAPKVEPEVIRMFSFAFFTALFEIVGQNLPKERAEVCIVPLFDFFQPGWESLLG
jgi:AcrR family transcriptional regulator